MWLHLYVATFFFYKYSRLNIQKKEAMSTKIVICIHGSNSLNRNLSACHSKVELSDTVSTRLLFPRGEREREDRPISVFRRRGRQVVATLHRNPFCTRLHTAALSALKLYQLGSRPDGWSRLLFPFSSRTVIFFCPLFFCFLLYVYRHGRRN